VLLIVRQALHHPFTAPHPDDIGDLRAARALAYDLVYNGVEVCFLSLHVDTSEGLLVVRENEDVTPLDLRMNCILYIIYLADSCIFLVDTLVSRLEVEA